MREGGCMRSGIAERTEGKSGENKKEKDCGEKKEEKDWGGI